MEGCARGVLWAQFNFTSLMLKARVARGDLAMESLTEGSGTNLLTESSGVTVGIAC